MAGIPDFIWTALASAAGTLAVLKTDMAWVKARLKELSERVYNLERKKS